MDEIKQMVPKRRFKKFQNAEAWEQCKLSSVCTMNARIGWQNLRTSEFLDSGEYYLITGTDFNNGKVNFDKCHYVEKERFDQDKKIQVTNGSILITKDGTLGKVAYVQGLKKPATLNAGVFNVRISSKNVDEKYLFQYLKAPFLMDYVSSKATGGTIKHLNQNILVDFPVKLPELNEQRAIGVYFEALDNLITLQQRKLEKVESMKKAYLYEMFPAEGENRPKRRFKGFTDTWEQCKLGDYTTFRRGSFPQPYGNKEWYGGEGAMPFIQVVDVTKQLNLVNDTKQKISVKAQPSSVFIPKDKVIVTLQGSIGRVAITQYDAYMDRTLLLFESYKQKTDRRFWAYTIQKKFEIEKQRAPGGTIKTITKEALAKFEISLPKYEEQKTIGNFFNNLDNLINLHQEKLNKLKNLKKAYLNEMFV